MKNGTHKAYGHGHGASGGGDPSHIPDSHLHDHHAYKELDFRAIGQFTIGLIATVVFSYVSMYALIKLFEANHETHDSAPSPVAASDWENPGPGIQVAPHVDLTLYEESIDSVLEGDVVGVMPIEKAMGIVLKEGLPYQEKPETVSENNDAEAETPQEAETSAIEEE